MADVEWKTHKLKDLTPSSSGFSPNKPQNLDKIPEFAPISKKFLPTKNEKFDHCHLVVWLISPSSYNAFWHSFKRYQGLVTPAPSSPPPMPTVSRPRGTHTLRERTDMTYVFGLAFQMQVYLITFDICVQVHLSCFTMHLSNLPSYFNFNLLSEQLKVAVKIWLFCIHFHFMMICSLAFYIL